MFVFVFVFVVVLYVGGPNRDLFFRTRIEKVQSMIPERRSEMTSVEISKYPSLLAHHVVLLSSESKTGEDVDRYVVG